MWEASSTSSWPFWATSWRTSEFPAQARTSALSTKNINCAIMAQLIFFVPPQAPGHDAHGIRRPSTRIRQGALPCRIRTDATRNINWSIMDQLIFFATCRTCSGVYRCGCVWSHALPHPNDPMRIINCGIMPQLIISTFLHRAFSPAPVESLPVSIPFPYGNIGVFSVVDRVEV